MDRGKRGVSLNTKQLPIPPAAAKAPSAMEILRVWVAQGSQHVSIATALWPDPAAWGLVLADLAQHVARAYEETGGQTAADALARIREALDAEWASPTDDPTGKTSGEIH
jgi:hypothetical protein